MNVSKAATNRDRQKETEGDLRMRTQVVLAVGPAAVGHLGGKAGSQNCSSNKHNNGRY